jgi:hypothetical protein
MSASRELPIVPVIPLHERHTDAAGRGRQRRAGAPALSSPKLLRSDVRGHEDDQQGG